MKYSVCPARMVSGQANGNPIRRAEPQPSQSAVQLAARIAAKAEGEENLVLDTLRGLVAGKGFLFADCDDAALRGFDPRLPLH
jgi:hypothetical protein